MIFMFVLNQLLSENLKELSESLTLLEKGIENNNIAKVEEAGNRLGEVFSQDWTEAVFEEDKKDIEKYQKRVDEIKRLYKKVQQDMIEYSQSKSL